MNFLPLKYEIRADDSWTNPDDEFIPDLGQGMQATSSGSFLSKYASNSRLLNTKLHVSAIAPDSSTGEALIYEAKKLGVEVLSVGQTGAKVVIELAGLAVSLYCLVAIVGHASDFYNRGKKITKETADEYLKKSNKSLFSKILRKAWKNRKGLAAAGLLLGGGAYALNRYKHYQEDDSDVQRIMNSPGNPHQHRPMLTHQNQPRLTYNHPY